MSTANQNLQKWRVYNWSARRSGPSITVVGVDHQGEPVRLSGVSEILPDPAGDARTAVYAKIAGGDVYCLMLERCPADQEAAA